MRAWPLGYGGVSRTHKIQSLDPCRVDLGVNASIASTLQHPRRIGAPIAGRMTSIGVSEAGHDVVTLHAWFLTGL
eukprot:6527636-Prymnesium_polylepis.1